MKGLWKDKQTGLLAEVISATDDAVWYVIPEWRGPQKCSREAFEAAMEPVTPDNSSPSNGIAVAPPTQDSNEETK